MTETPTRTIRERARDAWWHLRFVLGHPHALQASHPDRLRLVLGVGRSGTSWVGRVLAHSETPLRYVHEPLFHVRPALSLARGRDHVAIGYTQSLPPVHRLKTTYRALSARSWPPDLLRAPELLARNDQDWQVCLVKEVHALLATAPLLASLDVPCVILLRDPVYVLDSLLLAQGLRTPYLSQEAAAVQNPAFLDRYLPAERSALEAVFRRSAQLGEDRRRITAEKVLTIATLQKMLEELGRTRKNALVLHYEWLCKHPEQGLRAAAYHLSLQWEGGAARFLEETTRADNADLTDPYSVSRPTSSQPDRPLRFLDTEEREAIQDLLTESGLA